MSQTQQAQEEWVREMNMAGTPLTEYSCPRCGEPCFSLIPSGCKSFSSFVQCPHCNGFHWRETEPGGDVVLSEFTGQISNFHPTN